MQIPNTLMAKRLSKKISWIRLIFSVAICFAAGAVGSIFTTPAIPTWYAGLVKPAFAPPNYVFAPVWTTLYFLMGISLYLIWQKKEAKNLFLIHLVFNTAWSIIFFGFKNIPLALVNIIILWLLIAAMIVKFYKINKVASYLLVPYLAWVTVATYLNYSLFLLNF